MVIFILEGQLSSYIRIPYINYPLVIIVYIYKPNHTYIHSNRLNISIIIHNLVIYTNEFLVNKFIEFKYNSQLHNPIHNIFSIEYSNNS